MEKRMILAVTCKICGGFGPGAPTSQMADEGAEAVGWHYDGNKGNVTYGTNYICPDHALVTIGELART